MEAARFICLMVLMLLRKSFYLGQSNMASRRFQLPFSLVVAKLPRSLEAPDRGRGNGVPRTRTALVNRQLSRVAKTDPSSTLSKK